ncbi:hypothetical protein BDZ97DRAFT_175327 [Flammula alnicola]|nr:hypothetical protein BDZ97DRAFT_175327 [Flammula alnicola]
MSGNPSAKGKAKNFLHNLLSSFDSKKKSSPMDDAMDVDTWDAQVPPKPPRKPQAQDSKISGYANADNLIPSFNNLSVSTNHRPNAPSSNASFVGGFNPAYNVAPLIYAPSPIESSGVSKFNYSSSAPNHPRPTMAMPTPYSGYPQSLTMQMALRPPETHDASRVAARPHSNPIPPSAIKPRISSSSSTPSKPARKKPASSPSTPTKGSKAELPNAVSTPTGKAGQEKCAGVTKANKPCSRTVKTKPALSAFDSDDGDSSSIPRFCYQHSKEVMSPSGYYARKNGEWVDFDRTSHILSLSLN